jgi:uncharacterized repeat protein (TIGR01451 family)
MRGVAVIGSGSGGADRGVQGSWGGRVRFWGLGALVLAVVIVGLVAPAGALAAGLKVDFAAAAPTSYNHATGAGGAWGNSVKSLANAKGQFACGDKVVFFARIAGVSAADNPVHLDFAFSGQSTGQPGAGFARIVSASANTGDPANVNGGKPAVSIEKQAGGHPSPDLTGTVQITGLGSGDFILRLVVELGCTPGRAPTGTIQAGFAGGSAGGKPINGGTQTIPLKIADLVIMQSETVAPSPSGGDAVDDHILIVNPGPVDDTDVVLHDTVPAGTVIDSVTTDRGSCSVSGNEITCVVPHIDPGGTVNVDVITQETSADAGAGSPSDATATAAGLDPTPANNVEEAPPPPASGAEAAALAVDIHETSATVPLGGLETEAITITNDGPGAATGVEVTGALDAAAEVIAVKPDSASCTSSRPLVCTIDALPDGASLTIELEVRPLLPGRLIDAVSVSDDDPNALLAHDFATTAATVKPRRTAARLRIVPVEPVAKPGQMVEFVVIAGVTEPVPGVAPKICVTLPSGLRLTSAPNGSATPSRVCWGLTDLISGQNQSFRFSARVDQVPRAGATFSISGQLAGDNFTTTRTSARPRITARPAPPTPEPPPPRVTG